MSRYFRRLPIIHYNDMFARNILARVQLTKETKNNETIFYPYTLKDEEARLEVIAHKYYKASTYDWLVMMTNNIIDPYYGAGVPSQQLDKMVEAKYGTLTEARERIVHWRNDWMADDSVITTSAYDALLPGLKKYYTHVSNYDGQLIGYERKKEDWVVATNKLVECVVSANTAFDQEARVRQGSDTTAVVAFSNTTVLVLKHVEGTLSNTSISSNSITQTITSITQTNYSIPAAEQPFWTPLTAYEYEQEVNKQKRDILLLDKRLTHDVEKELDRLLDELQT